MKIITMDEIEKTGLRTIVLPSGIGEFQWVWTKLFNTGEDFCVLALDGAPRRLNQFAELHPQVKAFGWAGFDYTQIRQFQNFHKLETWEAIKEFGPGQLCMIACNPFLEAGNPLADWLPDLPTTYSYPITLSQNHRDQAKRVLHNVDKENFLIGISCASYRGAAAWKTWQLEEWLEYLSYIQSDYPFAKFVLIGGSWDDLTSSLFETDRGLRFQTDNLGRPPIGTLSFGGATALLQGLDAYIGFSSGLGHVAAHLCNTPVFMLWPEHEQPLSRTWVNPELLDNGSYVPSRWLMPSVVYKSTKVWLERAMSRRKAA